MGDGLDKMASVLKPCTSDPTGPRPDQANYVSLLFSNAGILLVLLVFILAAWFGQVPIAILAGLVIATIGTAKLWSYLSLKRVRYERFLSERRLFPGEATELKVRITNRKPLPMLWLEAEDRLPSGLAINSDAASPSALNLRAALLWYQRIGCTYSLKGEKRGYYRLGPAELRSGDIFGLYPRSISEPAQEEILVYPRIYPLSDLGLPAAQLWGDIRTRNLFHDTTRFVGLRDYRPNDSFKHIHWKASARRGELQVKTYESTATLEALLLVAIDSFSRASEQDFELALSTVASLAYYLMQQGCPVGLLANTAAADSGEPFAILPSSNREQLARLFEAMAKTTVNTNGTLQRLLEAELKNKPATGTTLILVAHGFPNELLSYLGRYKHLGYRNTVISVGEDGGSTETLGQLYRV